MLCFVLFCFVLFCFVFICLVLSCFVLFCLVLSCFVLFSPVPSFVCPFALTIWDGLYDTRPPTHPTHTLRCHPLSPLYILYILVRLFVPSPSSLFATPTHPNPLDPKHCRSKMQHAKYRVIYYCGYKVLR